jgi:hypothetical protein
MAAATPASEERREAAQGPAPEAPPLRRGGRSVVEHVELAIRDGDKRWAKALRARQAKWKQEAIERLTGSP